MRLMTKQFFLKLMKRMNFTKYTKCVPSIIYVYIVRLYDYPIFVVLNCLLTIKKILFR